jgi:Flp pilus assembly protein TadB
MDKLIYEVEQEVKQLEEDSRQEDGFLLPQEIDGKSLTWSEKKESRWYYVLLLGVFLSGYMVYREHEKLRQERMRRREELLRAYPGMISKFTMLLSTGTTVRNAWEKIVQNYSENKDALGVQTVYEEMAMTLREMQGGVSEVEAYERFGKRCGNTTYVKFGTLLSQNLRKGSKGLSDVMRMEAIQAFEDRKSRAKRMGEEAGTKLLMPMIGMLAVVFIMVMVPAFLSMQL